MTVATSLDSLLEKLKVEEPYLPPSNWESLHSQSRRYPPPTCASLPSSFSVTESSLLIGKPTKFRACGIGYQALRLGTDSSKHRLLGSLVFLLHNFVDPFHELQVGS
ncbi:hypothetical protein Bca101_059322 [Brassica carinata]